MEKKTPQEVLLGIYNETLESLVIHQINIELYSELDPEENIVPQEVVETGMRPAKSAKKRIEEIKEIIETKEKTIAIVERMLEEEKQDDDTGQTGE